MHEAPRDPMPGHLLVLEAIRAGDVEAARAAMTDVVRFALADRHASLEAGAVAPHAGWGGNPPGGKA